MALSIPVVYQDEHLLVANKPSGIAVIPERSGPQTPNVQSILQQTYGPLWVVHRIDRGTSGLVCFARNEAAHKAISLQFQEHTVVKKYIALVRGHVTPAQGEINAPIAENMQHRGTMRIHKSGKEALTTYEVLEQFKHVSCVLVQIHTGRTHQIRVHMAYIGYPLLVDEIYGAAKEFRIASLIRNYKGAEDERPTIARLTLHAALLSFKHPQTGEVLTVEAPMPKDMEVTLKLLRKNDL